MRISSIGALGGFPMSGMYSASKFALEGLREAVAAEMAPFGVRTTIVEPGGYWTDLYLSGLSAATPNPAYADLRAELEKQFSEVSADSLPELAAAAAAHGQHGLRPRVRDHARADGDVGAVGAGQSRRRARRAGAGGLWRRSAGDGVGSVTGVNVEPRVGRRPGRPPSLTRDDVARAALDEGVVNLSMPAVAKRLGVGHSTLYRYVHDRDDLLLAALDLALCEFEWPPVDLGWRELLTEFADAMWRFFERYPGMSEVSQVVPGMPARALDIAGAYVERLRAEGLSARDATIAVDFVADLTVAAEIGIRRMSRVFDTPRGRRSLLAIYVEPMAGLTEATAFDRRGWLDDKLAMLLDGLASRLGEPTAPTTVPAPPEQPATALSPATDRDAIAAAGRDVGRRVGLAAVSVQAVADELGATVTGVRREVGDRDGVVVAMLDAVAADIVMPTPSDDPRTELLALATAMRTVLLTDPWAVTALAVDGLAGPLILPVVERIFAAFRAAGVPSDEVARAGRILWEHLYGAILGHGRADTFARQVVRSANLGAEPTSADRTALGLELVVDGLLAHFG